jgi:uncharacterized protein
MKTIKSFPLVMFFILAFLFPWLIWGTTIAQSRGIIAFHIPQSLAFWIGLNLATYTTAAMTGGWPAIKDIFNRIIRWRVKPIWYLFALLFTMLLSLVSIGIHRMIGGTHQIGILLTLNNLIPSLLFQIFFFLFTEETAWRGFALPRLLNRYNNVTAGLILGILWGFWHLPLVFIPGSFQSSIPFIGFLLSAVATSILMSWLFYHSKGSVLVAAIFHAAIDTTIAFMNVMTGDLRLFWIFIIVQWVAAIVIIVTERSTRTYLVNDIQGTAAVSQKS